MKLIIPMAGKGTRLKPHTHTTPKALVHVAGKPMIGHVLDNLSSIKFDKAIFIVDEDNAELRELIKKEYPFEAVYIQQKERKGIAHAINGARKHANNDEVVIIFADTLAEGDFKIIKNHKNDGIIWTKQVKDPSKFGVVFEYNGFISQLIEKPENPISDLAIIGMYYFKNSTKLFDAMEYIIKNDIKTKGEYQITDAIQVMIDNGAKLIASNVKVWQDSGTIPNIIDTNRYLLEKNKPKVIATTNSVIIKPVFIEKDAQIIGSIIGPNVSIGKDAKITKSIISNSIINKNATVENAVLKDCMIGKNTKVKGSSNKLNIGDSSEIHYS